MRGAGVVEERHLARSRRYKRRKDRRIFVARTEAHDRQVVELRALRARRAAGVRVVTRQKLVADFVEVTLCGSCGRHVGVRSRHRHAPGGMPR